MIPRSSANRVFRKSRSKGNKSRFAATGERKGLIYWANLFLAVVMMTVGVAARGAEDPGARAVQQNQLQRQQQQEALQLRMQQQQRATQNPPQDARQKQDLEKLQAEQRQRQQELHYRQGIEPSTAQPSDDAGTRRAKEELERRKARQQAEEQLQRSDAELQKKK
jgi:hypothetical protein